MAANLYEQQEQSQELDPVLLAGGAGTRGERSASPSQPNLASVEESDAAAAEEEVYGDIGAEPRKRMNSTNLLMFVLLVAGAAGTYGMYIKTGSNRPAVVDQATSNAQATIKQFLADGPTNVKQMKTLLTGTGQIIAQFRSYPSAVQIPLADLKVNPFHYASAKPPDMAASDDAARKQMEARRAEALKAVSTLKLQSIMLGNTQKSCMINNTLYTEGAQFDGFTLEQINTDAVIVRYGICRFALTMKK